MNSKFNEEQIKAYAEAFEEGDAVWCDDKWRKVFKNLDELITNSLNHYVIRNIFDDVVTDGFNCSAVPPYRITTLEDYEYNNEGGEKIIWLGESDNRHTFGRVYNVLDYGYRDIRYVDDEGDFMVATGDLWGVIPRYEQVTKQRKEGFSKTVEQKVTNSKPKKVTNSKPKSETTDNTPILHKRYKNNLKVLLYSDLIDALEKEDYPQIDELLKLMDELKK